MPGTFPWWLKESLRSTWDRGKVGVVLYSVLTNTEIPGVWGTGRTSNLTDK